MYVNRRRGEKWTIKSLRVTRERKKVRREDKGIIEERGERES